MKTPAFWNSKNILSDLLLPFSWAYAAGTCLRKTFIQPQKLSVPVICIGNLTAGGAGKTPTAIAIGERLKQKGMNAFFLSRGYGGTEAGPLLVDPKMHSAREVGDEPLLLSRILPTVIARDRPRGANYAIALGADVIVMDDGLQNPSLQKTLSLLVVDSQIGFGNGRLLPAGPLRESIRDGLACADAVIATGNGTLPGIPQNIPVLATKVLIGNSALALKNKKVVGFCGLAYPQKFFDTLAVLGATIIEKTGFADHHPYSESDIKKLADRAKGLDAILVTTAKDAVRLTPEQRSLVTVVDITLAFENPAQLDALLGKVTKVT